MPGLDRKPPRLLSTEDYWAIWLGMLVISLALAFFWMGGSLSPWAVTPGGWSKLSQVGTDILKHWPGYLLIYLGFGAVFAVSMRVLGRDVKQFLAGYSILFAGSLAIFYLAGWEAMKRLDLGAPLLALAAGLLIGNVRPVPDWFKTSLRTEYYIKTGIVLLGATLPLTLIFEAGPIAFVQATIVSVTTWLTIYLAATRLFGLDPRFGAVLGTGGAVCGVSGSIAIGGAVKAEKDHIAIGIAVVSIWAIVMIFTLSFVTKWMIPAAGAAAQWYHISPGEAGAWVGTSEYADAAGFAVVAELASRFGDAPINAFTLMKVIGRDIWIGIWAFTLSIVSVLYWEKKDAETDRPQGGVGFGVVWERFPKFVLGFFAASVVMSMAAARPPAGYVGKAPVSGVFKTKAEKRAYKADFAEYRAPAALADRFSFDPEAGTISFAGRMSGDEFSALAQDAGEEQRWALKELRFRSDWFESRLKSKVIGPIKKLRSWAFVLCFLCIGLSTRFKELANFGLKPFWAFTIGVMVNVPLGYFLTTRVFAQYWKALR